MFNDFKADVERYAVMDNYPWLFLVLTKQGLWITAHYRFSRWVNNTVYVPVIREILKLFSGIWRKLVEISTCCEFPSKAEIGKGLYLPHASGIFINSDAKIGEYCNLSQDVTIGVGGRGEKRGCPKLGNRVFVGPGARIFGPIAIGNNVAIGANAVVTKDLPDNAVAVGVPAKIISYKGSEDFIICSDAMISSLKPRQNKELTHLRQKTMTNS
ncbi:MAG: serine acetyltransferase [Chroococcidiopsidaceae cyanobacterium CP_BM_ER_R8_30]|nr:serine acetyltransferase [Chroococcidiopsidaceae cyanobacterium CP_BM_ER_R8_30]